MHYIKAKQLFRTQKEGCDLTQKSANVGAQVCRSSVMQVSLVAKYCVQSLLPCWCLLLNIKMWTKCWHCIFQGVVRRFPPAVPRLLKICSVRYFENFSGGCSQLWLTVPISVFMVPHFWYCCEPKFSPSVHWHALERPDKRLPTWELNFSPLHGS